METWVRSLGWEDTLKKGMATYSSILAWGIPWTEKPGGLQSMGSQEVQDTRRDSDEHYQQPTQAVNFYVKVNETMLPSTGNECFQSLSGSWVELIILWKSINFKNSLLSILWCSLVRNFFPLALDPLTIYPCPHFIPEGDEGMNTQRMDISPHDGKRQQGTSFRWIMHLLHGWSPRRDLKSSPSCTLS